MNARHIDSWKDLDFIAATLALISRHHWNQGASLRPLLKAKRRELRGAIHAFNGTAHMPCGYQDAAGDRCERIGAEYMQMVHAYLACKYGQTTKRLGDLIDNTLPAVAS